MNALEFDRVSHDFVTPAGRMYRAIDEVSLAIPAGAFVALVGPSGCGKTTVLNLAAGLLTPSSGRVRVDGADLAGLNQRATYMFQQDALLPWKNVRDNVGLGLTLAGASKADACARADEWLARVGLSAFASHYPSQLSGGMRKRVAIAQNWILDRSQVLMDEPFSALDVHTRQLMETELLSLWDVTEPQPRGTQERRNPGTPELRNPGTPEPRNPRTPELRNPGTPEPRNLGTPEPRRRTVLFVTHDLEEAIALADEVIVLSAGPASRVVARHRVGLARPRDLFELRTAGEFVDIYRSIWSVLREEVIKSQSAVHRV